MIFKKSHPHLSSVFRILCAADGCCIILFCITGWLGRTGQIFSMLLFFLLSFIACQLRCADEKNNEQKRAVIRQTVLFCFLLYSFLAIFYLFFDSRFGRSISPFSVGFSERMAFANLRPFATVRLYFRAYRLGRITKVAFYRNIFGNLVLLMPYSVFLPILFPRLSNPLRFLLTVFLIDLGIELTQWILLCGVCDVDDFILNLLGAFAAYLVFQIVCKRRKHPSD